MDSLGFCENRTGTAKTAAHALNISHPDEATLVAAAANVLAGFEGKAQGMAQPIAHIRPDNMFVQVFDYPLVQALIAIKHNQAERALELLRPSAAYSDSASAYVRATAYIRVNKAQEAVHEFQRIRDLHSFQPGDPLISLAILGQARSYRLLGDTNKARTTYQDFFALWKDADPDVPILKQAKTEYAKLQ